MTTNGLIPTLASQWKRPTFNLELPSGNVVEVCTVSVYAMIDNEGGIPSSLMSLVVDGIEGKTAEDFKLTAESIPDLIKFAGQLCTAAFVTPKIVDNPDYNAGEISIKDVADNDRIHVLNWVIGGGGQSEPARKIIQEHDKPIPAT